MPYDFKKADLPISHKDETETTNVLYIAGAHRSGTTLLTTVLGSYEGIFAAGELHEIWNSRLSGRPCGCGARLEACELWGAILDEVERKVLGRGETLEDVSKWRAATAQTKHTFGLHRRVLSGGRNTISVTTQRYAETMRALYEEIRMVTRTQLVVDSTKIPSGALLLKLMNKIDAKVLHLVRDPRATAHSWANPKSRRVGDFDEVLTRISPAGSGMRWLVYNTLSELVRASYGDDWRTVRYEDVISDPRRELDEIVEWTGIQASSPFVCNDELKTIPNHTIAGNPDRFSSGYLQVKPDVRWLSAMPPFEKRLVEAISFPLMSRYGYGLWRP